MKRIIPYNLQLHNEDNLKVMATIQDESIDVICIDPPYLYLKGQKLERVFDEQKFFSECKRLLTKNGFMVMFGRGESFYRWNTILADLGFKFKEEIIWDKRYVSSPLMRLSRVHETIAIFTKNKGTINKVKVPYLEMKSHDIGSIITDVKRLKSILKNTKSLNAVLEFLKNNENTDDEVIRNDVETWDKPSIGYSKITKANRCVSVMQSITKGLNEKSIIRSDFNKKTGDGVTGASSISHDRCVTVMQSMSRGLNEKSIIKQGRDHYSTIHPTQKPVRLLERLLALVIPADKDRKDIVVADFFAGSMSTMEAVHNVERWRSLVKLTKSILRKEKKELRN